MASIHYPFRTMRVYESEIRDWLTRILYPTDYAAGGAQKSRMKKRIAARIRYARSKKRLGPALRGKIDTAAFFEWACAQKGWEALLDVEGLPRNATVAIMPPESLRSGVGTVDTLHLPDDEQAMREVFLKLNDDNRLLREQVRSQMADIENLERQVESRTVRAARASEYGKLGRGVKKG